MIELPIRQGQLEPTDLVRAKKILDVLKEIMSKELRIKSSKAAKMTMNAHTVISRINTKN